MQKYRKVEIQLTVASMQAQCKVVAVLLHFFFMSSFSWMLMEGILLYFQSVRAVKGDVNFKLMLGWCKLNGDQKSHGADKPFKFANDI